MKFMTEKKPKFKTAVAMATMIALTVNFGFLAFFIDGYLKQVKFLIFMTMMYHPFYATCLVSSWTGT